MSFFRTVFSLCSGTELFPKLLEKPSLFRAFFHLFLLLILCTAGVTIAAWLLNRDNVDLVCDRFMERTGGFEIKPNEILIGKEKERSRGYKLTETLRFDYFAKAEDLMHSYNLIKATSLEKQNKILLPQIQYKRK